MLSISFIVALIFLVIAAVVFCYGLAQLSKDKPQAQNTISAGLMTGLVGIVVTTILFGFFSL